METTRQTPIIRTDSTIDTTRAMARGHDARTEALRAGFLRLAVWLRRARTDRQARSAQV